MTRWISRLAVLALPCVTWLAATAAPGDWDVSFAQSGRLPFTLPGLKFNVRDWLQQPDGKVVIVGHPLDGNSLETPQYIAARFNLDGTPDTSFDADGYLTFDFGSPFVGGVIHVVRQTDGKLLIAAQGGPGSGDARLMRLNVNGSRDASYGLGGEVTLSFPNDAGIANPGIKLTSNGDAVVLMGYFDNVTQGAVGALAVTRVTSAGVVDATFGTGGTTFLHSTNYLFATLIDIASDGKILIAGETGPFQNESPMVARLTSTGQPDATFGTGGIVVLPFLTLDGYTTDMVAASNGQVVLAGARHDGNGNLMTFLSRLTNSGATDPTFGSAGRIIVPGVGIRSIALEPDGKIVVGGSGGDTFGQAALARYDADGSPDVTFGTRSVRLTDFSTGDTLMGGDVQKLRRNADATYTALVVLQDSILNNFASSFVLAHFAAQGTHPGVLGIRAEFESSATGGFSSVLESTPTQKFYVYRTGGTDGTVSVQYRTVSGTAIAGQDFVAKSGTVTLNDGEIQASFDVDVIDDPIPETVAPEQFHVELFAPTGGAGLSKQRATVEIMQDDDYGQRVILYGGGSYIESGTARFLLNRTGDMRGPLTMNYTVTPGSATAGGDFVASSGSVTWAANQGGYKEFTVSLVDDGVVEPAEDFTVTVSDPNGVAAQSTALVEIIDDDDTTGPSSVALGATNVYVGESGATATVQVYRLGNASQPLSVPWAIGAGSGVGAAMPGSDYVDASGTLVWAAGNRAVKTIPVAIVSDSTYEPLEVFSAYVNLPFPVAPAGPPSASIVIKDDDGTPAHPVISIGGNASVNEGAGTLSIPVTLTGLPSGSVDVTYTITPESTSFNDLAANSGTLQWIGGASGVRTIDVPINDDALDEQDETFAASLSRPGGGATLGTTTSRFTILDNDPTPAGQPGPIVPSVQATPASVTVSEGQRTATVDLRRTGDTSDWLYVWYAASDGTAASPSDFVVQPNEVAWPPFDNTVRHIEMQINGDGISEPTETLALKFRVFNIGYDGPLVVVPVTITDDDAPAPPAHVGFLAGTQSVSESQTSVIVPVSRSGNLAIASSVDYATSSGTAGSADFTASTGTLTWAANDNTVKNITVPLLPDTIDEADETFTLTLSNASSGTQLDTAANTITIQDDDVPPPPPHVGFSSAAASVPESATTVSLEVARTGDASGALTVSYATATGTAGSGDFTAKSGTLTWAANDAAPKTISVTLLPDTVDEPDESFTVTLSNAAGAQLDRTAMTVTIQDDDVAAPPQPAHVGVMNSTQSVSESQSSVTIQVGRAGNTAGASSVDYATAAGTAGTSDYTATTGTLTWVANDTATKAVTITLLPDTTDEPDETFTLTLSNPSSGTTLDAATTTVTISDDDPTPVPPPVGGGSSSSGGGKKGGGSESLLSLLILAALVLAKWGQSPFARKRGLSPF